MKKGHLVLFLLMFVGLVIIFLVLKKCFQESKRAQTIGTVQAVHAAFLAEFKRGNPNSEKIFTSIDQQWQFLPPKLYDRVIIELAKLHNLDPPKNWRLPAPLFDFWGNRFEIGYRRLSGESYDFIVVSKWPDGIYGTKDDVVSEYDAFLPPKVDEQTESK